MCVWVLVIGGWLLVVWFVNFVCLFRFGLFWICGFVWVLGEVEFWAWFWCMFRLCCVCFVCFGFVVCLLSFAILWLCVFQLNTV